MTKQEMLKAIKKEARKKFGMTTTRLGWNLRGLTYRQTKKLLDFVRRDDREVMIL